MSCGNPVAEGQEALMERRSKLDRSIRCVKCKLEKGNLVIRHAAYCKNCFFSLVTTKFRRCIEPHINESSQVSKRTALRASGNLLVGFSGGLGSTTLLDLVSCTYFPSSTGDNVKGGSGHPRNKRVWTKAYACYVEVCNAFPEGQMRDRSGDIKKYFEGNDHFELVSARIENAFDPEWWKEVGGRESADILSTTLASEDLPLSRDVFPSKKNPRSAMSLLRTYLTSLPTPTAVQSAISLLTRLILIYTAQHLKCSHLALGTSLTSLSISLITAIAQGGGFNLREEYFEEWQDPSIASETGRQNTLPVRVVRPLRDVGMKECAAWAYWKELSIIGREKIPVIAVKQTIGFLTKSFIVGLERDYPSTVSTIVRTCNKVTPKDEPRDRCVLCERPTPAGVLDWKARISVRSRAQLDSLLFSSSSDETKNSIHPQPDVAFLSHRLCYACHTHLISKTPRSAVSVGAPAYLPQWTNARLTEALTPEDPDEIWSTSAMNQGDMKAAIDDYLI